MKKLIIHHHLGLGDHFICNGLVRFLVANTPYDEYILPTKKRNCKTVAQMYSDLTNLKISPITVDDDVYRNIPHDCEVVRIGFENLKKYNPKTFDQQFYEQFGLFINQKKLLFFSPRNPDQENKCYEHYDPPQDYIFVHDVSSIGKCNLKIDTKYPIVRPTSLDYNLLDHLKLIERAKEVHCINSSFFNMIDLCCERDHLYFHQTKQRKDIPCISFQWKVIQY